MREKKKHGVLWGGGKRRWKEESGEKILSSLYTGNYTLGPLILFVFAPNSPHLRQ